MGGISIDFFLFSASALDCKKALGLAVKSCGKRKESVEGDEDFLLHVKPTHKDLRPSVFRFPQ